MATENDDFKKLLEGALKVKNRRTEEDEKDFLDEDASESVSNSRRVQKKKRACENCVCGRAEGKKKLSREELKKMSREEVKKLANAGCGGCKMGDAFRCGDCPFYGLPSFEEGDEVFFD
ncbi:Protein DRE2, required for cell viability [Trachipleistophora hominis]|uniref:Protein DRE2, required for cell viability n=1 Tax=Trachipleistophora hominis TaxID=72359 RepID=L7K059_TRAHO|nr:Protein DRE2, required for cell viability [Trachipleistophora hominis]